MTRSKEGGDYPEIDASTDVTGTKSFLGVVNYFHKFIPRCSVLAEPLLRLTRGKKGSKTKFTWGED